MENKTVAPISVEKDFNPKLTPNLLTLGHLKIDLMLRFGSYAVAGRSAGLSSNRVKQIVNGFKLPEQPDLIKRIADGWNFDAVTLTLLFDRYRGLKG